MIIQPYKTTDWYVPDGWVLSSPCCPLPLRHVRYLETEPPEEREVPRDWPGDVRYHDEPDPQYAPENWLLRPDLLDQMPAQIGFRRVAEYAHKIGKQHWEEMGFALDSSEFPPILVRIGHCVLVTWWVWTASPDNLPDEEVRRRVAEGPPNQQGEHQ